MPVDYVGDQTQTRAPSAAPEPEGDITIAQPGDLDPPNGSTFAQPLQVMADFINHLMRPRAKPGSYDKPVRTARSARQGIRFVADHYGFPMGKFAHFRDDLRPFGAHEHTGNGLSPWGVGDLTQPIGHANVVTNMEWRFGLTRAVPNVIQLLTTHKAEATGPEPPPRAHGNCIRLRAGPDIGDKVGIQRDGGQTLLFATDVVAVLEWDAALDTNAVNAANNRVTMGLGANLTTFGDDPDAGIYFRRSGVTNWHAAVRQTGGAVNAVDSLVAPLAGLYQRFRIVWAGSVCDDFGLSRALFFINGALVANITTDLPASSVLGYPIFGINRINAVGSDPSAYIGMPIVGAHNTLESMTDSF